MTAVTPLANERRLTTKQMKDVIQTQDTKRFWETVRRAGIPYIRISARRCIFEESAVRAWLDSRRVGGAN